jgi:histidine ammonia-lyase
MDNAYGVLGIELMTAAQALDFREHKFGFGVQKAKEVIRKYVEFLDIDRPLFDDQTNMKNLVE